jgi:hypothetical protein
MQPDNPDIYLLTFADFVSEIPLHPSWIRHGQWLFNLLWENDRELVERIRGTDLDPFHWPDADYLTSQRWQNLMQFLATEWKGSIS